MNAKHAAQVNNVLDDKITGERVVWMSDFNDTLKNIMNVIDNKGEVYQKSFIFDRPVAGLSKEINSFFDFHGFYSYVCDYNHSKLGMCSWLVLIADTRRLNKYKKPVYV